MRKELCLVKNHGIIQNHQKSKAQKNQTECENRPQFEISSNAFIRPGIEKAEIDFTQTLILGIFVLLFFVAMLKTCRLFVKVS